MILLLLKYTRHYHQYSSYVCGSEYIHIYIYTVYIYSIYTYIYVSWLQYLMDRSQLALLVLLHVDTSRLQSTRRRSSCANLAKTRSPVQTWRRPTGSLGDKNAKKICCNNIYIYTRIYYIWLDIYIVNSTYITYISYMTRTHSPTFFNTPPHIFSQAMLRGHTKSASSKNPTCSARRIQNLLCVEDGHHNPQGRSWCRLFHGFFHWKCAKKKQVSC